MKWLVFLAACGCAGVKVKGEPRIFCETECGMFIAAQNGTPLFACEDYLKAESLLREELHMLPLCEQQRGVVAWEVPGFASIVGGVKASGWTDCWLRQVSFHTGDGFLFYDRDPRYRRHGPEDTAFVHELIHVAQGCVAPVGFEDPENRGHEDWEDRGYYRLIDHVNGKMRESRNEGR